MKDDEMQTEADADYERKKLHAIKTTIDEELSEVNCRRNGKVICH